MKKNYSQLKTKLLAGLSLLAVEIAHAQVCNAGFSITSSSITCVSGFESNQLNTTTEEVEWIFGDGTTLRGPNNHYTDAGIYSLNHGYTNGTYTVTQNKYINASANTPCSTTQSVILVSCGAASQTSYTYVNASQSQCANQSLVSNSTGNILLWKWTFDNGLVKGPYPQAGVNNINDFLSPGVHTATLCTYSTSNTLTPKGCHVSCFTVCDPYATGAQCQASFTLGGGGCDIDFISTTTNASLNSTYK